MSRLAKSLCMSCLGLVLLAGAGWAAPRLHPDGEPDVPACRPAHGSPAPSVATARRVPLAPAPARAASRPLTAARKTSRGAATALAPERPTRLDPLMTL